jgi:methyl acetate hydrolase
LRTPLAFEPGTRWEYGTGIDWAGLIVEAVSGKPLGQYFADHLFGPLGMSDTAFVPTDSMRERLAGMHRRRPDGGLEPIDHMPIPDDREYDGGGGGLFSTMGDYGRFLRMFLNDGELDGQRVLEPATVATMAQNHRGALRVTLLRSANPALSNDAELFRGEEKSWGLTFQVHEQRGFTGRPKGTLSWAGLANSYFWIDRVTGIAGAYLTQLFPFADHGALALYYDFERAVYDSVA